MKNKQWVVIVILFVLQAITACALIQARHRIRKLMDVTVYLNNQNEITGDQIESIGQELAKIDEEVYHLGGNIK